MGNTFSIKTLGCKLNQYESSLIAGQFTDNGWVPRPFGESVDLVIVNTCTVTNKSDKKCRNYIRQGSEFSKTGQVLVTGCLAERESSRLCEMPGIFAIVKNSDKEKIFSMINNSNKESLNIETIENKNYPYKGQRVTEETEKQKNFPLPFYRTRGLVKIQDGCDGKCSYCVVPSVRGKPVSRDFNEILEHSQKLIDSGCPEIILTGITIGKYNSNNKNLSDLIKEITAIKGKFRVRITSIEPNHVADSLIDCLLNEKVCPHIHIPLQSGSDKILNLMQRPYTAKEYINAIEKIKEINDAISIGTDIIIGFPGETEEDFSSSLKMIEKAGFSYVHQFAYSPRPGTPCSEMHINTSREISDRSIRLRKLAAETGLNYRKRFLGKKLESVIERNKNIKGYSAVSGNYIKMKIEKLPSDLNDRIGKITRVQLLKTGLNGNIGMVM